MALLTESLAVDVVLGTVTLLGVLYLYITSTYNYWRKRGVPYIKPSFPFGSMKDIILKRKHFLTVNQEMYHQFPSGKVVGYFEGVRPVLMVRDPDLVQRILIKDFTYFVNRGLPVDEENDPLTANLVSMEDQQWKNLRNKLTPTFTTGKLKGMIDQIRHCGGELKNEIEKTISKSEAVDAKKISTPFTTDVIASCAFGLQFRPDSPEGVQIRQKVGILLQGNTTRFLLFTIFRRVAKIVGITQFTREINEYFMGLVHHTIQFRKTNNIERNDFLQLMMNLKKQEDEGKAISWKTELSEKDKYLSHLDYAKHNGQTNGIKMMTDEVIAAQSFVFLLAGSEGLANSVAFMLFELGNNPTVQKRLQQEVDSVLEKHGGKITQEALKEMTYLDLVIQERNRKYSDGAVLTRVCSADCNLPGTNIVVEKGMKIIIPIHAIHNDPAYYPEPDEFIPERFEGNNYRSSGTYLPFGDGPRICIAMRFALLELKACIALIMSKYSVTLDPRTQVPLKHDPKTVAFSVIGGVWVKFHKRENVCNGHQKAVHT